MKDKKPDKEIKTRIRRFQNLMDKFRRENPKIQDAKGHDVPIHSLTERRIARQAAAVAIKKAVEKLNCILTKTAEYCNDTLENYRAWRDINFDPKESKNDDINITSHDGQIEVGRKKNFSTKFTTESVQSAYECMMPVVQEGAKDIDPGLRDLVFKAFSPTTANRNIISLEMLLDYQMENEQWKKGQTELRNGKTVVPGRSSLICKVRNDQGVLEQIPTALNNIKLPEDKE